MEAGGYLSWAWYACWMDVVMAVLCDYTTLSLEGKLSVLGIFDNINAPQYPARHPRIDLALRLQCKTEDIGLRHPIRIDLIDEDGLLLSRSEGSIDVATDLAEPPTISLVHTFENLVFPKPGRYVVHVFLSGHHLRDIPLNLSQGVAVLPQE